MRWWVALACVACTGLAQTFTQYSLGTAGASPPNFASIDAIVSSITSSSLVNVSVAPGQYQACNQILSGTSITLSFVGSNATFFCNQTFAFASGGAGLSLSFSGVSFSLSQSTLVLIQHDNCSVSLTGAFFLSNLSVPVVQTATAVFAPYVSISWSSFSNMSFLGSAALFTASANSTAPVVSVFGCVFWNVQLWSSSLISVLGSTSPMISVSQSQFTACVNWSGALILLAGCSVASVQPMGVVMADNLFSGLSIVNTSSLVAVSSSTGLMSVQISRCLFVSNSSLQLGSLSSSSTSISVQDSLCQGLTLQGPWISLGTGVSTASVILSNISFVGCVAVGSGLVFQSVGSAGPLNISMLSCSFNSFSFPPSTSLIVINIWTASGTLELFNTSFVGLTMPTKGFLISGPLNQLGIILRMVSLVQSSVGSGAGIWNLISSSVSLTGTSLTILDSCNFTGVSILSSNSWLTMPVVSGKYNMVIQNCVFSDITSPVGTDRSWYFPGSFRSINITGCVFRRIFYTGVALPSHWNTFIYSFSPVAVVNSAIDSLGLSVTFLVGSSNAVLTLTACTMYNTSQAVQTSNGKLQVTNCFFSVTPSKPAMLFSVSSGSIALSGNVILNVTATVVAVSGFSPGSTNYIANTVLVNCTSSTGGTVYITEQVVSLTGAVMRITNTSFLSCGQASVLNAGGALLLMNLRSNMSVSNCTFISSFGVGTGGTAVIASCSGVITFVGVTVQDTAIYGFNTLVGGAGFSIQSSSCVSFSGLIFSTSMVQGSTTPGVFIALFGSNVTLSGVSLSALIPVPGGMISADSTSYLRITGLAASNLSGGLGVLLYCPVLGAQISMSNSVVSNISASLGGGGVIAVSAITLINCTFTGIVCAGSKGAAVATSVSLVLINSSFADCVAAASGAAVYSSGTASLSGVSFTGNTVSGKGGGAIWFAGSSVTLSNCSFSSNSAPSSGSGGAVFLASGSFATFSDCVLSGNSAAVSGGAIFVDAGVVVIWSRLNCSMSAAGSSGGCAYISTGTKATLSNCLFESNSAGTAGGSLWFAGGSGANGSITASVFSGNQAPQAGALYLSDLSYAIIDCSFTANQATGEPACQSSQGAGGAVYIASGLSSCPVASLFSGCSFVGNMAEAFGGAVAATASELLCGPNPWKTRASFSGNTALYGNDVGTQWNSSSFYWSFASQFATGSSLATVLSFEDSFLNPVVGITCPALVSPGDIATSLFLTIDVANIVLGLNGSSTALSIAMALLPQPHLPNPEELFRLTLEITVGSVGPIATTNAVSYFLCQTGQILVASDVNVYACLWCQAGSYSSSSRNNCLSCPPGTYSSFGSVSCSLCPPSTYAPEGSAACISCPPGMFSNESGVGECSACPLGSFTPTTGQQTSATTAASGASNCTLCPVSMTTLTSSSQGSQSCFCDEGFYGPPCLPCVALTGVSCAQNSSVPLVSSGLWRSLNDPNHIYTCLPASACASTGSGSTVCADGYTGRLCGQCLNGHKLQIYCASCNWISVSFFWVAFLAFLVAAGLTGYRVASSVIPVGIRGVFRPLLMGVQKLSLLSHTSLTWPPSLQSALGVLAVSNFSIDVFAPGCVISLSFWASYYLEVFLPGMFLLLVCAIATVLIAAVPEYREAEASNRGAPLWMRLYSTGLGILVTVYTYLATVALSPFRCVQQPDGTYVFQVHPDQACYDAEWWSHAPSVFVLTFVILVAMPILLVYKLWQARGELRTNHFVWKYGIIASQFRAKFYWWEVVLALRRILFVMLIDVTGSYTQDLQSVLILGFCMLYVVIESVTRPYRSGNEVSIMWQWLLILYLLVNKLIFNSSSASEGEKTAFLAVLWTLLVVVFVLSCIIHARILKIAATKRPSKAGSSEPSRRSSLTVTRNPLPLGEEFPGQRLRAQTEVVRRRGSVGRTRLELATIPGGVTDNGEVKDAIQGDPSRVQTNTGPSDGFEMTRIPGAVADLGVESLRKGEVEASEPRNDQVPT